MAAADLADVVDLTALPWVDVEDTAAAATVGATEDLLWAVEGMCTSLFGQH